MRLDCYALSEYAPKIVAARQSRAWMDDFRERHAYRCLPLSIANCHGWEVLCPVPIEIVWTGGLEREDIEIRALKPLAGGQPVEHFCRSNFSRGIATFHVDYIFRTDKDWNLLATGPFNRPKDNAYPLTGIIESDWLPYTFTMNWQVLRPGRVLFEEGEPYCFLFPVRKQDVVDCQPHIRHLSENPELSRQHQAFRQSREEHRERRRAGDPAAVKEAWQRHYFVGRHPDGTRVEDHVNKLRVKEPNDLRGPAVVGEPHAVEPAARVDNSLCRAGALWEDDSPLARITTGQSEANTAGRRRIDARGQLTSWDGVQIVDSQRTDTSRDFLVVENFLSERQCQVLGRAYADLGHKIFTSDRIDPYWNNRFIRYPDIAADAPEAGEIMVDALRRAIDSIARFYRLQAPIYADLLQLVHWKEGVFMPPHADNANPDGSPHKTASREFAGILYLNSDYQGGELFFTAHDTVLKPKAGMLAAFTGGFHHEHAVLRVEAGIRLTVPFFLTFDRAKANHALLKLVEAQSASG